MSKSINNTTGVWLIGARGQIATITAIGLYALQKKMSPELGLVTGLAEFSHVNFREWGKFILGGTDIRNGSLEKQAEALCWSTREIPPDLLESIRTDLQYLDMTITAGTAINCGEAIESFSGQEGTKKKESLAETVQRLRQQLVHFRQKHSLDRIIVVNLASTEPPAHEQLLHSSLGDLEQAIENNNRTMVRGSTLYAYAALQEECAYINFTPSQAALPPAIVELAEYKRLPVMGSDGKTGETLVKSVLAPMFAMRNLRVLSWEGFNILGNRDGQVLNTPANRESKIRSKDHLLPKILGYTPHTSVHINYVPSLDDQKTAWDFIHFQGFLGTKMSLQFIWQGFDSILAAPLVLDLVRMTDIALDRGESGTMPHLSCFFKSPLDEDRHDLADQFARLFQYVRDVSDQ